VIPAAGQLAVEDLQEPGPAAPDLHHALGAPVRLRPDGHGDRASMFGRQQARVAARRAAGRAEPATHHQDQPTRDAPRREPGCGPAGRVRRVGGPFGRGAAPPHARRAVAGDLVHLRAPARAKEQPAGPSRPGRQPLVDAADTPAAHDHDVHPGRTEPPPGTAPLRRRQRGRASRRRPGRTPPPRTSTRRAPPGAVEPGLP
jgi:hypothetical protein